MDPDPIPTRGPGFGLESDLRQNPLNADFYKEKVMFGRGRGIFL